MSIADEQTSEGGGRQPAPTGHVRRPRRSLTVVLLVLALLLAGAAGAAAWQVNQLDDRERAHEQALAEADTRVPLLLSYRFSTLEDDLATALAQTTGDITDDYRDLLDNVVNPPRASGRSPPRRPSTRRASSAARSRRWSSSSS